MFKQINKSFRSLKYSNFIPKKSFQSFSIKNLKKLSPITIAAIALMGFTTTSTLLNTSFHSDSPSSFAILNQTCICKEREGKLMKLGFYNNYFYDINNQVKKKKVLILFSFVIFSIVLFLQFL